MTENSNNYADIRQIVVDAVSPIKDQLDRLYDSLSKEFVRKDAIDPQIQSMKEDIRDLEAQVMGTTQRYLLYFGTGVGALLSILTILHDIHIL